MTGNASIIRGDARNLPLADNSVDLVVTSPPYFGLRSYIDNGVHYQGQIGDEATPAEFIAALLDVTRECVRVLKPSGSMFVNLGDRYAGVGGGGSGSSDGETGRGPRPARGDAGVRAKSLMLIPERYRIACVDQLGLIARAVIVWDKPNGLPESVTDRVRRSHEDWVHLTKQPRYYSAVDEIREEHSPASVAHVARYAGRYQGSPEDGRNDSNGRANYIGNPLGKLPGSVWTIPTQPLKVPAHLGVDHFAAYPMEWPRRIIRGWSPPGVCTGCGEGRRPVVAYGEKVPSRTGVALGGVNSARYLTGSGRADGNADAKLRTSSGDALPRREATVTGYACACTPWHMQPWPTDRDPDNEVLVYDWHLWDAPPTTPAVILDPFGGTGTTALVAKALGRHGISVDMSADYCRLAEWRTNDPAELARAMQVDKPPVQLDGQLGMFEEEAS